MLENTQSRSRAKDLFIGLMIILAITAGGTFLAILLSGGLLGGRREKSLSGEVNNLIPVRAVDNDGVAANTLVAQTAKTQVDFAFIKKIKREVFNNQTSLAVERSAFSTEIYNKGNPVVVPFNDGFVMEIQGVGSTSSALDIFVASFNNLGELISGPILANPLTTITDQKNPSLANCNGTLIIAYQTVVNVNGGTAFDGVRIHRLSMQNLTHEAAPDTLVSPYISYQVQSPTIACSIDGTKSTITFQCRDCVTTDKQTGFLQLYSGVSESGGNVQITTSTRSARDVVVVYTPNGNRFFGWTDSLNPSDGTERPSAFVFNEALQTYGAPFFVDSGSGGRHFMSMVASSSRGDAIYAWFKNTGIENDVLARVYNQNGNSISGEITVNTILTGDQSSPFVFAVTKIMIGWMYLWKDNAVAGDYDIRAQFFTPTLSRIGRPFIVNHYRNFDQTVPKGAELDNGNVVISYKSQGLDNNSGVGVAYRILIPDVGLFFYNTNLTRISDQNTIYSFSDLILNPALDADTASITLKVNPVQGHLNITDFVSTPYGNATSTYNEQTGELEISGSVVPLNDMLTTLKFMPSAYVTGEIPVELIATDGIHSDFDSTIPINVMPMNYPPDLTVSTVLIEQNTPFVLTQNFFNASNPDPNVNRSLIYTIDSPLRVTFFNLQTGLQILTFTQGELDQGIRVVPDDSGFSPSFIVKVTDAITGLSSAEKVVNIVFYPRPVIEALGPFDVSSDATFTFTEQTLNATSISSQTGSLWKLFDIKNAKIVEAGTDNALTVDDTGTVTFSRDEVLAGQIGIKPDGSSNSPSLNALFCVPTQSVTDNFLCSRRRSALFNFNFVVSPESNITAKNNIPLIAGLSAGLGFAALLGVGGGVFACYRHSKNKELAASRANINPLADWVRTYLKAKAGLKLNNIKDFSIGYGADFVTYISEIQNHANQNSVDEGEIKNLADNIAEAINAKINAKEIQTKSGEFVNLQDLQGYASAIAILANQKSQQFEVASP